MRASRVEISEPRPCHQDAALGHWVEVGVVVTSPDPKMAVALDNVTKLSAFERSGDRPSVVALR